MLQGRRNFIKRRIKELERKKKILEYIDDFIGDVKTSGLTENKWDRFSVTLKDKALGFSELGNILYLTENSESYYFKPSYLHIKITDVKTDGIKGQDIASDKTDKTDKIFSPAPKFGILNHDLNKISRLNNTVAGSKTNRKINTMTHNMTVAEKNIPAAYNSEKSAQHGDVTMSLKGFFLVRKN